MPNATSIEWTDFTSNGLSARRKGISFAHIKAGWFCDKPDAKGGCASCYAESLNLRWGNGLRFDKTNRSLVEFAVRNQEQRDLLKLNLRQPGKRVFIGDMFDLFQPSIPTDMVRMLFNTYDECSNLELQFLTKYTARMAHFLTERYGHGTILPEHFIIGMSAATRSWFDKNIYYLLKIHARRFISFEPLLEDMNLDESDLLGIDWLIIGGESGNRSRPCNVTWIRSLLEKSRTAKIPAFVKQLGNKPEFDKRENGGPLLIRKLKNGKGVDTLEWPEDLRVREMPEVSR